MNKLFLATLLTSTLISGAASAQGTKQCPPSQMPGWYTQVSAYATKLEDHQMKFGNGVNLPVDGSWGPGVGASVGYKFGNTLRAEAEIAYRNTQAEIPAVAKGDVTSTAGMVNLYSDFAHWDGFTPYVGAGVGAAFISDIDDTVPAYQLMLGTSYQLDSDFSLVAGYRFFATKAPEDNVLGVKVEDPYRTHNIELGLRYNLN